MSDFLFNSDDKCWHPNSAVGLKLEFVEVDVEAGQMDTPPSYIPVAMRIDRCFLIYQQCSFYSATVVRSA